MHCKLWVLTLEENYEKGKKYRLKREALIIKDDIFKSKRRYIMKMMAIRDWNNNFYQEKQKESNVFMLMIFEMEKSSKCYSLFQERFQHPQNETTYRKLLWCTRQIKNESKPESGVIKWYIIDQPLSNEYTSTDRGGFQDIFT